jgi:hypothetical protein
MRKAERELVELNDLPHVFEPTGEADPVAEAIGR